MKKLLFLSIFSMLISVALPAQMITDESYRQRLDAQYASSLFRDRNAYMFTPQDDVYAFGRQNVLQYLQGRVPGLVINSYNLFRPTITWRMNQTVVFLDEIRVDPSVLTMINLDDIGLVKVFRPPFVGAFGNGAGGAIAVYTLQDEEEEN